MEDTTFDLEHLKKENEHVFDEIFIWWQWLSTVPNL